MLRWPRSTIARFAILSFLVLALSNIALLWYVFRATSRQIEADLVELVSAEQEAITDVFDREGPKGTIALIEEELRAPAQQVLLLVGPDGRVLAGNAQGWPPTLAAPSAWRHIDLYRAGAERPERFGVVATNLRGYRLLVGHSLDEQQHLARTLMNSLIGALGLALVLGLGGAWALAHFIGARVRVIADVAGAVARGNLSQRIEPSGAGDAFDALADALNAMLARIEALVDELRMVTDGLAHDLRSPLMRLRARIDRARAAPCLDAATFEAIDAEVDRMLAPLETALEISRAEAGIGRDRFTTVDVAALMRDLGEMYAPLAEEHGMTVRVSAPPQAIILGLRDLLAQALANAIDNALKHATGSPELRLSVVEVDERIRLMVEDHGPGIPANRRAFALQRFARLDAARSTEGAGLGLTLAAAITRMHGGQLILSDNRPGLSVIFDLPCPR